MVFHGVSFFEFILFYLGSYILEGLCRFLNLLPSLGNSCHYFF